MTEEKSSKGMTDEEVQRRLEHSLEHSTFTMEQLMAAVTAVEAKAEWLAERNRAAANLMKETSTLLFWEML
jgi:hypothetical protein